MGLGLGLGFGVRVRVRVRVRVLLPSRLGLGVACCHLLLPLYPLGVITR